MGITMLILSAITVFLMLVTITLMLYLFYLNRKPKLVAHSYLGSILPRGEESYQKLRIDLILERGTLTGFIISARITSIDKKIYPLYKKPGELIEEEWHKYTKHRLTVDKPLEFKFYVKKDEDPKPVPVYLEFLTSKHKFYRVSLVKIEYVCSDEKS
jgi:hypothetical protein